MSDERYEGLTVDIDLRLAPVWQTGVPPGGWISRAMEQEPAVADLLGAILRAAYIHGYSDALREDRQGRRAELYTTHGYPPE